jgi:hypothetical protein
VTTGPDPGADRLDALSAELVAHARGLAQASEETARLLGEVLAERARLAPHGADGGGPLPADVQEVAALEARLAGVRVEDYLRAAVLAHSSCCRDGHGADGQRLRAARREALRIQGEGAAREPRTGGAG